MILMRKTRSISFSCGGIGASSTCPDVSFLNAVTSQVFPLYSETERLPSRNSALARIREKRAEYNERVINVTI